MSYENPTRAIDTQTGQHLANLQNTISGTFQGIAKSYKAEQDVIAKELKNRELTNAKLFKESQLIKDTLFENTSKTTARLGISQGAGLNKLINETSDLINANNSGKLSLDQVTLNKQKIAANKAAPENIKRLYAGITQNALALSENKEKNGTYGGLDKFGDPEVYEDLSTWLGTKEGSRELLVETLSNGIDLEVYAVINGRKYSGTQIQRLLGEDSQLVTTIPDPRKDWDNLTNATFLNIDAKTGGSTFEEKMLETPIKEFTEPDSEGRVFEIVTRKTKKDDLLAAGGADAKASIEAMSPRERAALWNNELAPKDNLGNTKEEELVDVSIANTEDFNEKLQKAWTNKWFETKIGDRVEISRTEVKTTKLTPAQQLAQNKEKEKEKTKQEQFDFDVKKAIWSSVVNMKNLQRKTFELGLQLSDVGVKDEEGGEVIAYSVENKGRKGKTTINISDTDEQVTKKLLMALGYSTKKISDAFGDKDTRERLWIKENPKPKDLLARIAWEKKREREEKWIWSGMTDAVVNGAGDVFFKQNK